MKTLKSILLLVLVTTFLISCGDASDATENTTGTTEPTTETTSGETPAANTATATTSDGASKITDAVVKQACDCQENARREDKTIDFSKVRECMGGKNKIQFVADLLGADASEKERSDAEGALSEKMKDQCPK